MPSATSVGAETGAGAAPVSRGRPAAPGLLAALALPPGTTVLQQRRPDGAVLRAVHLPGGRSDPPAPPRPSVSAGEEATRMPRERTPSPDSPTAAAGTGAAVGQPPAADDPHAVRRYSLLEQATRCRLLHELAGVEAADARGVFLDWEQQQDARQAQAVADVWRRVGRFLVGSGDVGEQRWGDFAWRRLYLTEVAPWADYTEGDEYRFLGMPGPGDRGTDAARG